MKTKFKMMAIIQGDKQWNVGWFDKYIHLLNTFFDWKILIRISCDSILLCDRLHNKYSMFCYDGTMFLTSLCKSYLQVITCLQTIHVITRVLTKR